MTTTQLAQYSDTDPATWWRQAVVYQVYPRSFTDTDGDGIGNIAGITSRADYLKALGVDAVWLSPFYPSELADGGYDVADYRNVDPRLGTLDDFDEMVAALGQRGIRVIVDIVPNHTSNQHEWFKEALAAGRGSAARERYIFREGLGENGELPPSDWTAAFGGPAWERVEDGQWYYHHFATEQPDLNWDHPDVHEDFLKTLRFWSDRGVAGFRIDVAHMLKKDFAGVLPTAAELEEIPFDGNHPLVDRDDVQEVYAEWREVFNSYDPPRTAVAEAWVASDRVPRYANPESLGQAFNFDLLQADFDADQFREIVTHNVELAQSSGSSSTWVLSNHDVVRHPTRYGLPNPPRTEDGLPAIKHGGEWLLAGGSPEQVDRDGGLRRARAATLFLLGLPGSAYIYQGEELGLHEVGDIPDADRQDPAFFRNPGVDVGRDGCRVPLPWANEGPSLGFGDADAHIPQPSWFAEAAASVQDGKEASTLELYREALRLRRQFQAAEDLAWVETGRQDVLHFARPNGWQVITNFGDQPYVLDADVALSSGEVTPGVVAPQTTVWVAP